MALRGISCSVVPMARDCVRSALSGPNLEARSGGDPTRVSWGKVDQEERQELIPLTGYRVLMTWVYSHTRSVLVAMAMHASWTGWQFFLSPANTTQGQDAMWHLLLSAGIWAVVLTVVVRSRMTQATWPMARSTRAG